MFGLKRVLSDQCGYLTIDLNYCIIKHMGILDNFENAWDPGFQYESTPIVQTNNMGEPMPIEQGLDEEVLDI